MNMAWEHPQKGVELESATKCCEVGAASEQQTIVWAVLRKESRRDPVTNQG